MSGWRPDLTTLKLFVAVCDEASITKAAEREAIAPSAVSKRIAEVESAAGVMLLVRGGRGVKPTAAGQAFLEHARRILESTTLLEAELEEYGQGARGHVRLWAHISSMVELLPKDVTAFMLQHPNVRVDLQERVSSAVAQGVREGAADLGVCLSTVDLFGVRQYPYSRDELVLVCRDDHALANEAAVDFDQVMAHDLVGLQPGSRMETFLAGLAARKGRKLRYRSHVSTYEAALAT
ncbi:LysR family transcriptional regulator [Ramlibacter sp. G-1-2-2]|uniref:LysR family transcriptional regulator n=1 Tax=Ramlibacter agri TaxID=2728837 RepID=A0A848HAU1_9BURK|nr:LysR family transcriptional regulator [Ramlibacter agri]NML47594.1 LysR family transcriptional regulator [Ramlibacter agri]